MFEEMNRAIEVNGIRPVADKVFPFDQAPNAFRALAAGDFFWKFLVTRLEGSLRKSIFECTVFSSVPRTRRDSQAGLPLGNGLETLMLFITGGPGFLASRSSFLARLGIAVVLANRRWNAMNNMNQGRVAPRAG
jgi:hypothetical protein